MEDSLISSNGSTNAEANDNISKLPRDVSKDSIPTYSSIESENSNDLTFTVEDAVEKIGFGKFQWKLSILTGFAWMADSMEMMILSIISPELRCVWLLYTWQEALITTVVFIGMMLSSSMWGNICDQFGRRTGLIMCVVFTFYMGLLSSFSPNFIWILILRGLVGFGIGGVPQSVTLYSEFLPQKSRATCIMLIEVFWAVGTCVEVVLALLVMPSPALGWRWLLGFSSIPLLLFTLACKWLPESARYNVLSGHTDRALDTLKDIAKQNGTELPPGRLISSKQEKRGRIRDLFKTTEMAKTTVLLWLIWFNCSFAYYGVVLMTTELLQQDTGSSTCSIAKRGECNLSCHRLTTHDYVDLLWTTLAEFPGLFVTLLAINYIGRKKTMALTMVGFALFSLLLNLCTTRTVMIFFLFVARAFISGGFQAAYVYTPEVYPTNVRAIGLGSCSGMSRLGAIITPFFAQVMLHNSMSLAIGTYAGVSLVAMVCSLLLPIETKGRMMQDDIELHDSSVSSPGQ